MIATSTQRVAPCLLAYHMHLPRSSFLKQRSLLLLMSASASCICCVCRMNEILLSTLLLLFLVPKRRKEANNFYCNHSAKWTLFWRKKTSSFTPTALQFRNYFFFRLKHYDVNIRIFWPFVSRHITVWIYQIIVHCFRYDLKVITPAPIMIQEWERNMIMRKNHSNLAAYILYRIKPMACSRSKYCAMTTYTHMMVEPLLSNDWLCCRSRRSILRMGGQTMTPLCRHPTFTYQQEVN